MNGIRDEIASATRRLALELLIVVLAGVLVLLAVVHLSAAPSPLIRREPPARVARFSLGAYTMHWAGTAYQARFDDGGRYEASGGGTLWVGTWRIEPPATLHIREPTRPDAPDPCWTTYRITLAPCLREGSISGGQRIDFRLTPPRVTD